MTEEKVFSVSYESTVRLTSQDIDDIMVDAFEGGITYWCGKADVVGDYLGEYASDQISRGGSLVLYDNGSSDKWELTLEKFLNGIKLWLMNDADVYHGVHEGRLDAGQLDSCAADSIVQYALFGEVVFG